MEIEFAKNYFILDPKKAAFYVKEKWLLIADVHWGKTHFFQKHGLAISHNVLKKDLENLKGLIKKYNPTLILCLGDLFHHETVLKTSLGKVITEFRNTTPTPMALIKGNHDIYIKNLPEIWGIDCIKDHYSKNDLVFTHELNKKIKMPQIYGHLHPKITLKGEGDYLSAPCFLKKRNELILPAFSEFCGGKSVELKKSETAYICAEERVISFP